MLETSIHKKIRELATCSDQTCVSLYLPVLQGEQVGLQNPIRLKNLAVNAEEALIEHGWRSAAAWKLSAQILEQSEKARFWEDGSRGLAIFASAERLELIHLPQAVAEDWTVGRHFQLTPLLDLETDRPFALLAISQNQCRLLQGDRWSIEPVALPSLPASEADALPPADHQRTLQSHGGIRHGSVRQTVHTGQGGAADFAGPELQAYCRQIDAAVCKHLGECGPPLVLAAVRHLVPVYRGVSHYPHLLEESIDGSPDHDSLAELHRRAWELLLPTFAADHQSALANCASRVQQDRAAQALHEIVSAAHEGRVQTLWVAPERPYWGTFDPIFGSCRRTEPHAPGAEDLVNLATVYTLRHHGNVFLADLSQAGVHEPMIADFKFATNGARSPRVSARQPNAPV